jgi:hypothetical protein
MISPRQVLLPYHVSGFLRPFGLSFQVKIHLDWMGVLNSVISLRGPIKDALVVRYYKPDISPSGLLLEARQLDKILRRALPKIDGNNAEARKMG